MYKWNWFAIYEDGSRIYEFENGKETLFNTIKPPDCSFGIANKKNLIVFPINAPIFNHYHDGIMDCIQFDELQKFKNIDELKFKVVQYKIGATDLHADGRICSYLEYFVVGLETNIKDYTYRFLIKIDAITDEIKQIFEKYYKGQLCNDNKVEE